MLKQEKNYIDTLVDNLNHVNLQDLTSQINKQIEQHNVPVFIFYNDFIHHIFIHNIHILEDEKYSPEYNSLIATCLKKVTVEKLNNLIIGFIKDTYDILMNHEESRIISKFVNTKFNLTMENNLLHITPGFLENYSLQYLYHIFNASYTVELLVCNLFYEKSIISLKHVHKEQENYDLYTRKYMKFFCKIIYNNLLNIDSIPMSKHHIPVIFNIINDFYQNISKETMLIINIADINSTLNGIKSFYNNISYLKLDFTKKQDIMHSSAYISSLTQMIEFKFKKKQYVFIDHKTLNIIQTMYDYSCLFDNNVQIQLALLKLKNLLDEYKDSSYLIKEQERENNICHFNIAYKN